jgi:hypothetical protein
MIWELLLDSSDKLARFRPRLITAVGPGIATAVVGGSLLALTEHLLFLSDLFMYLAIFVAGIVGIFIAALVYNADPGEWRGYLARIALSASCAVVSGVWAGLSYWMLCPLVNLLLRESQFTANCAVVDTFLVGLFLTTLLASVTAVGLGRKRY